MKIFDKYLNDKKVFRNVKNAWSKLWMEVRLSPGRPLSRTGFAEGASGGVTQPATRRSAPPPIVTESVGPRPNPKQASLSPTGLSWNICSGGEPWERNRLLWTWAFSSPGPRAGPQRRVPGPRPGRTPGNRSEARERGAARPRQPRRSWARGWRGRRVEAAFRRGSLRALRSAGRRKCPSPSGGAASAAAGASGSAWIRAPPPGRCTASRAPRGPRWPCRLAGAWPVFADAAGGFYSSGHGEMDDSVKLQPKTWK